VLRSSPEDANALADAIREVKERIRLCEVCFNLADEPRCRICQDERRDASLICVVEEPGDVIPIERTHEYRGRYHVLGGALSPIDGVDPEDLKIASSTPADRRRGPRGRPGDELDDDRRGDRAVHRRGRARARAADHRVAPGVGLPVGGDLEYADEVTLGRALSGRRTL
jgi:recombination protein RecR